MGHLEVLFVGRNGPHMHVAPHTFSFWVLADLESVEQSSHEFQNLLFLDIFIIGT